MYLNILFEYNLNIYLNIIINFIIIIYLNIIIFESEVIIHVLPLVFDVYSNTFEAKALMIIEI